MAYKERKKEIITGNVIILGLVSLFTDISSEMIVPLIPLFLTTVLLAPVTIVAIIEGIVQGVAVILKGINKL